MASWDRTWRDVDGVRVEGCRRHAFICNGGRYFLTDLKIYADGMVDCWELVPFEQFAEKVRSGWVATGDMDNRDVPLLTLMTPEGEPLYAATVTR